MRVAGRDQLGAGQRQHRVAALDLCDRIGETVGGRGVLRAGNEVEDDFGIGGRLTDGAIRDDLAAERQAVGEVAVVGNRDAAFMQLGKERLDVAQRHFACRRVARVADGHEARELRESCGVGVVIADETHALFGAELLAVEGDDTCSFLAAMLERMQAERRQRRGIRVPEDAEHAALFVQGIAIDFVMDFRGSQIGHHSRLCSVPVRIS